MNKLKYIIFSLCLGLICLLSTSCGSQKKTKIDLGSIFYDDENNDNPFGYNISLWHLFGNQTDTASNVEGDTINHQVTLAMEGIFNLEDSLHPGYSYVMAAEQFVRDSIIRDGKTICGYDTLVMSGNGYDEDTFVENFNQDNCLMLVSIKDHKSGISYKFPKDLCGRYFTNASIRQLEGWLHSNNHQILASVNNHPIAIKFIVTRPDSVQTDSVPQTLNITFVSTPLLFSNYGTTFDENHVLKNSHPNDSVKINHIFSLVLNLMRQAGFSSTNAGAEHLLVPFTLNTFSSGEPSFYITYLYPPGYFNYSRDSTKDSDILLYLLKQEGKTLLSMLIMLLLIIAVPICIRRRQRTIPIIEGPQNRTVGYIRQISKIYLWENNLADLLKKRIVFFYNDIYERIHIHLDDKENFKSNCLTLSKMTDTDLQQVCELINKLNTRLNSRLEIDAATFNLYVQQMNQLTQLLEGKTGETTNNTRRNIFKRN